MNLAELSEREAVRLLDRQLQVAGREARIELLQVLLTQLGARIWEMDDAVEAAWSAQNRRIEDRGFVGGCYDNDPLASAHAVEIVEELLQADATFRLAGFWERAIKVFKKNHGRSILHGEFKKVIEIAVINFGIKKPRRVCGQTTARHHRSDSGRLAVAGRSVQQVTATERELICAKPSFALKERLKVIFKKRSDLVVEDKVVPLAADNLAFAAADNVEAWLVVASIRSEEH